MKKWLIILLYFSILYAADINQKMILDASIDSSEMKQALKEVKHFFNNTASAKKLQKQYGFTFQLETVDKYTLLILKPIDSYPLKNKLKYLLKKEFPKNFIVDNSPLPSKNKEKNNVIADKQNKQLPTSIMIDKLEKKDTLQQFWNHLSLEWIALIVLALAGLLLVYRSAKQISKIKKLQKKVESYQHKIEKEISAMGDNNE